MAPAPPYSVSSPAPPLMVSLPSPPSRRLALASPVRVSSKAEPARFSMLLKVSPWAWPVLLAGVARSTVTPSVAME